MIPFPYSKFYSTRVRVPVHKGRSDMDFEPNSEIVAQVWLNIISWRTIVDWRSFYNRASEVYNLRLSEWNCFYCNIYYVDISKRCICTSKSPNFPSNSTLNFCGAEIKRSPSYKNAFYCTVSKPGFGTNAYEARFLCDTDSNRWYRGPKLSPYQKGQIVSARM